MPGHFGEFGGRYVPETLIPALDQLEMEYQKAREDPAFRQELDFLLENFVGRPTPLYPAKRLAETIGSGVKLYLKREDLCHTGSHKLNNTVGQVLLAVRMGKKRIIAETGAGQHGVATATASAMFGRECVVYMGEEDIRRQKLNVFRMKELGASVVPVKTGSRTLKDATNEALRDWMASVENTHYVLGSVVGPHPFPTMVGDFQSIIGKEAHKQILELEGRLPDYLVACVGGGSNSIGLFHEFIQYEQVKLIGVEAGGMGLESGKHAASLTLGKPGVLHGSLSYVLQDSDGQTATVHSVAAGLDYPGVGPEHSFLKEGERARYATVSDREAIEAFRCLSRLEGIIPALESSHAVAYLKKLAPELRGDEIIILNLSGRGDKDAQEVVRVLGEGD